MDAKHFYNSESEGSVITWQCDLEGRVPWGDIAVLAANIGRRWISRSRT